MYKVILALSLALTSCGGQKKETKPQPLPTPPADGGAGQPQPMPPIPTPPGGGQGDIVEKQQYLVFHNLKRCWHAVGDIQWDDTVAASAKAHAQKCTLAKDPLNVLYGENIAFGEGLGQIKAQDDWYMQFLYFPYGQKEGSDTTQEFSNIVWKETSKIGCGSAQCGSKSYYVCRYSAKGNIAGQYDKNVFMLKSDFGTCTGMPRG